MGRARLLFVLCALSGCAASPVSMWSQVTPSVRAPSASSAPSGAANARTATTHSCGNPLANSATDACAEGEPVARADALLDEQGEAGDDLGDAGDVDDGLDSLTDDLGAQGASATVSPLDALSDHEIEERLLQDTSSLGSISIGATNAGMLIGGVQMPTNERWHLVDPAHAYGTRETVESIARAIDAVHKKFPNSPKLYIGHISAERGGHLSPHKSHQAGRDVDISYFLEAGHRWYARATAKNLDRARSWAFVRAFITETDVEMILIDTSVQRILKEYALKIGEDPAWLDDIFQVGGKSRRPIIRHAKGHQTHLHVRLYSPLAQKAGARTQPILVKLGKLKAPMNYVAHRVKKGQTLGILAKRYGTTVEAIMAATGLRSSFIKAKQVVRIPRPGAVKWTARDVVVPPRRLPPG